VSIYVRAIFAFPSFQYIVGPLSKLAYTHVLYIFLLLKATQIRLFAFCVVLIQSIVQGRIQDFKLGGAHLKKLRRAEGGAKIFEVFRMKNHDFTPKNLVKS
jgi:hypothetical protein